MRNVLIVDDEPLILEGLRSIIEWEEYGLTIIGQASNGEEAVAFLKQYEGQVDLLITDITMPKMNGLQLIEQVKTFDSKMRYVILSGYEQFEYVKAGMRLGIENYILKPINIKELESTVRQIVDDLDQEAEEHYRALEDWQILRSNIMNRWVTGTIDAQELRHRSDLLDISLTCDSYTVTALRLIMEPDPDCDELQLRQLRSERMGACYGYAQRLIGHLNTVYAFIDTEGDLILIFGEALGDELKERIHTVHQQLQYVMKQKLEQPVWITIGSKQSRYQDVSLSYEHAKSLYVDHLMLTGYPIIDIDQLPKLNVDEEKIELDYEAFSKLLLAGEREEAHAYIESAFNKLLALGGYTRIDFYNVAIKLMLMAKNMEKNADFSPLFNPLLHMQTIEQLMSHVQESVSSTLRDLQEEHQDLSPNIRYMIEQVSKHYKDELSLKTISQRMEMHPNYLGQMFHKEVGRSFSDYVTQYRIEKARQLLLQTTLLANEVAAEVGYLDPTYFYRQFKKSTGVSPTELRKMYQTTKVSGR
ncbi:response regulator transcription factor [Paenibacillus sp. N1-5-1-14]|uniref:response regulator transcription factor n=1 Tax=Paenibacillus radicibacter TaxID=2972488 RepID=UPI00215958A3|nr:response regulator transcription factor [Paenibacillus radicibacter]MCR8642521.1 response regulator transcription factor [Paenibacillus radicibacter]